MKIVVLTAAALAVLALLPSASTGGSVVADVCKPGMQKIAGTAVYVYCGPGRATVRTGGRSFRIVHGRCGWRPALALYVVDIGIQTIGKSAPKARYLGLRAPHRRAGTYNDVAIALQLKGKQFTLGRSAVTIAKDLRHGTFSGDFLFGSGSARGSWAC